MTDSQSLMSSGHAWDEALQAKPSGIKEPPRYERKKAETRGRIYRAALKLFAEQGLAATSVDEIVAAADVAKGTFFNYFRSKELVFAFFIEIQLEKVAEAVEEARKGKQSVRTVLHRAFRRLGGEIGVSPHLAQALIAGIVGNDVARETVAGGMADARQLLAEILRLGQERGQVRTDRTAPTMSLSFQQAVLGTLVAWAIRPQVRLAALLDASFEDYWACVAARRASRETQYAAKRV